MKIVKYQEKLRKIERMKKRRIVPRIILTIVFLALYLLINVAIVALTMQNMLGSKILAGYKNAQLVSATINAKTTDSVISRDIYNMHKALPDIDSVVVVDSSQEIIRKYGDAEPDFSKEIRYLFSGSEMTLIPASEDVCFNFDDDGMVSIDFSILMKNHALIMRGDSGKDYSYSDMSKPWMEHPMWLVVPCGEDGNKVCVLTRVCISKFEALCFLGTAVFMVLIGLLFLMFLLFEMFRTVSDQRRAFCLINTDFVTLGNNRIFFVDMGYRLLKKRRNREYVVVHLRLEKYRMFRMYHGEARGEEFLQEIYLTLKNCLEKRELVAHYEGADFALLLLCPSEEIVNQRVEAMIASLKKLEHGSGLAYSAGIAKVKEECDPNVYYNAAGLARGTIDVDTQVRLAWFNEELLAARIWEHKVEEDMEEALAHKDFKVYLQPKYCTRNERLGGAEALVRWIHPTEGFVPPGKFIPIFENNGFITKLDDYMITEVARQQAQWLQEGKEIVPVSVNVSRIHFLRKDLAEHICEMVDQFDLPHEYIELELTESAFFDDKSALLETVRKLKEYGFHVSMDDFGSGYSSLNSLKELPLDVVKLDAEFFRGTDDLNRANLIVSRTIDLAKQLGMQIVAEGIETREQVDFLAERDCDLIQGYYFAKPMPIQEYEEKAFGNH